MYVQPRTTPKAISIAERYAQMRTYKRRKKTNKIKQRKTIIILYIIAIAIKSWSVRRANPNKSFSLLTLTASASRYPSDGVGGVTQ